MTKFLEVPGALPPGLCHGTALDQLGGLKCPQTLQLIMSFATQPSDNVLIESGFLSGVASVFYVCQHVFYVCQLILPLLNFE